MWKNEVVPADNFTRFLDRAGRGREGLRFARWLLGRPRAAAPAARAQIGARRGREAASGGGDVARTAGVRTTPES